MNHIPLDYAVIAFPGNQFKGEIAPELYRLMEEGFIRIIDLIFISKDSDGGYTALELNELSDEELQQFVPFREQLSPLFTDEDVKSAAEAVPPNSAALIVLWQNIWTENIRRAVANANGRVLLHERIPAEIVNEVMDEIAAGQE